MAIYFNPDTEEVIPEEKIQEIMKEDYGSLEDIYLGCPIRYEYDEDTGESVYLIKTKRIFKNKETGEEQEKDYYIAEYTPLDIADELARVGLIYHFIIADKEEGNFLTHEHYFDAVLNSLMRDPSNFFIPEDCSEEYSKQEIELLSKFREPLCNYAKETPKYPIVSDYEYTQIY